MLIDCNDCALQHTDACHDCVVTFILAESDAVEVDAEETSALGHLAEVGLVPPLRLVPIDRRAG